MLADERRAVAVRSMPCAAARARRRPLPSREISVGTRSLERWCGSDLHGATRVRHGHGEPSRCNDRPADAVLTPLTGCVEFSPGGRGAPCAETGENSMDPRETSDVQATGTLPLSGQRVGARPCARARGARAPAWLQEARDGLTQPGKYLAYEESGRQVVTPLSAGVDPDRPLAGRRRPLRRRDGLAPSRARRQPGRGRTRARRPLAQRRLRQRRARRVGPLTDGDEITIGRHAHLLPGHGDGRPGLARRSAGRHRSPS